MATTATDRAQREGIDARAIAALDDPAGVLSIYVGTTPGEANAGRPAWEIAMRNGLRDAVNGAGDVAEALEERIEALGDDLRALADPAGAGRGRALFAGIASGQVVTARMEAALPDIVRVGARAHMAPLLAALDEGAPVGLVSVARDRVRAVDLAWGTVAQVLEAEIDVDTGEWREYAGPAAGDPGPQSSATDRDRFERRLELHRVADVAGAAGPIGALADRLGWTSVVVGGDPRMVEGLADALRGEGRRLLTSEERLDWTTAAALADAFGPLASADRHGERMEWIDAAVAATAAEGHGATGPEAIDAALALGRVERLIIDAGLAVDPSPPDGEDLIRRGLETDAQVVVVASQPLVARLEPHGGVAASLRW